MNKEIYKQHCNENPDIPLFSQYWWMNAACNDKEWDVLLVKDTNDKIMASMPYLLRKKFGMRYIIQPLFAQTNGIWFRYPKNQTENEQLSFEKKICNEIIAQIEKLRLTFFLQNFHFTFTNWLPFYWKGFTQTTRYTYRIPDISDLDAVYSNFSVSKKGYIKKAEKNLKVFFDLSPKEFYHYKTLSLQEKGEKNTCPEELFLSCSNAAIQRGQGAIITIKDEAGNVHAGVFTVWDKNSGYYLFSFTNPDFRSSGASSLLIKETLKYLSGRTLSFDFEGSMIEGVENAYRHFGALQTPYFQIKKSRFKWIDCLIH